MITSGGTTTLGLYDNASAIQKKADITYVDSMVGAIAGGHKGYATLALATAATSTLPANTVVEVTNDSTSTNNGLYLWNGTVLTKSNYDPLTQAQTYTNNLEFNRTQNPNKLTLDQVLFNALPTSTTGTRTFVYRNNIKQMKLVSASTGGSIITYWDFDASLFTRDFSAAITVEDLTAGSNGYIGIQQLNSSNTIISSTYAITSASAAVQKQTFKVNVGSVTVGAVKIRLIINMQTTSTREMYVYNPFIADGTSTDFITPVTDFGNEIDLTNAAVDVLNSAFTENVTNNLYNPTLATNGVIISYATGNTSSFANGISLGKHNVTAGNTYIFALPLDQGFTFTRAIYTYDSNGVYLGVDHSIPSAGELVNPNPPTGIAYSDADRTVKFTIPVGSSIAKIAMMTTYITHTTDDFDNLVNNTKLEIGSVRTAFTPYTGSSTYLVLKPSSLPTTSSQEATVSGDIFTVTISGIDAYIRTKFTSSLDLVQQIRYGANSLWVNNAINPQNVRTIPSSTSRDGTVIAFATGTSLAALGDDAAPLYYNGTYIGANHGALIVQEITMTAHGKTFVDVGSQWTQGANTWTIVRVVDVNKLWLVSQNTGSTYWQFVTTSLNGLTLTHSTGATNTSAITPTASSLTQFYPSVNNHSKKIIADSFIELTENGVYDVKFVEFVDNYDIMSVPATLTYLQANVGTPTEQNLSNTNISSDVRVSTVYRYSLNGSCTVNTQLQTKSALNFTFSGITQAGALNYSGKSLLYYVPRMNTVTVGSNTYNLSNVTDVTSVTDIIYLLKANWTSATNPPDRLAHIVKNGSVKEFGHVVGYSLERGITKPSLRQNVNDAGFFNGGTKKMYPKAITSNLYPSGLIPSGTVVNAVAYRSVYSSSVLPEATVYTWYADGDSVKVVLDIHQNVSMLKLPLPQDFAGKSATLIDTHANFTLHSEMVSDGGLLCSVVNNYATVTIKLT
jgi:hypothetical protein